MNLSATLSRCIVLALCLAVLPAAASAQENYPNRMIKVIVPFPAGTAVDVVTRMVADKLVARWGQPIIIENRPGATGNLGAEMVAKAEPDGYTLMATPPPPLAINQSLYPNLSYDAAAFVPISLMTVNPNVLIVHPSLPANTWQELVALAKAKPDELTYGSTGPGGTPQLTMEMFKLATGATLRDISYRRGVAPAVIDLLAGRINAMFVNISDALSHVQGGSLRALAVTTEKRITQLPNVPALAESIPGFYSASWFAVMAPPRTPQAIVQKLSDGVMETLRMPDVVAKLQEQSMIVAGSSPQETDRFIKEEIVRWRDVIVKAGIKPE
jgi:tripartite-type tricarboxylate transporter receptor subunit TctC